MRTKMKYIFSAVALLIASPCLAQQTTPAEVDGGIYNSSPPTLTNRQSGVFQLDTNGNLKVNLSGTPSGTITISGNVGGFDSGSSPIQTATPANSSHAAGVSVGGLFSIPIARTNGGSGIATTLYWTSTGGAVTQLLVRLWDKNPTNTTCTDNTAFAESATDDQHLLITPFTMTPAAPANTTGDTNTYITVAGLTLSFKNQDAVATKNVYACVLTTATDTADENKAVYINLTGVQD